VIFLRKLIPGGSEHSFGIHVAKLAGMPGALVRRAEEVLEGLESQGAGRGQGSNTAGPPDGSKGMSLPEEGLQMSFFQLDDPVLEDIKEDLLGLDIDRLTPVEALLKLHEIRKRVGG
jgi:DNA mismatch repair protein MutS